MILANLYGDMKKIAQDVGIEFVEYLSKHFAGKKIYVPKKEVTIKRVIVEYVEKNNIKKFDEDFYRKAAIELNIQEGYLRSVVSVFYKDRKRNEK